MWLREICGMQADDATQKPTSDWPAVIEPFYTEPRGMARVGYQILRAPGRCEFCGSGLL